MQAFAATATIAATATTAASVATKRALTAEEVEWLKLQEECPWLTKRDLIMYFSLKRRGKDLDAKFYLQDSKLLYDDKVWAWEEEQKWKSEQAERRESMLRRIWNKQNKDKKPEPPSSELQQPF